MTDQDLKKLKQRLISVQEQFDFCSQRQFEVLKVQAARLRRKINAEHNKRRRK